MTTAMKLKKKNTCSLKKNCHKPRRCIFFKKQRHHFADKFHIVKAMVFPVVMHGCERGTKAEHLRIRCFQTVVLEKTLESPLDGKEIKPVNPKGNQPWLFIERMMLKLKLHYFGHLTQRANSLEKTLMLGKIEAGGEGGSRGWDSWIASQLSGHEFEQTPGDSGTHSNLVCCSPWVSKSWTWLSHWTTTT